MDSAFFGRGVFGIFTSMELATSYRDSIDDVISWWEIKKLSLIGGEPDDEKVYAAYTYYELYDCYSLEGIYANGEDAKEAVGKKGMVVEFVLDRPNQKRLLLET